MTWESIDGWFDFQEVYDLIGRSTGPGDIVVEVGSYLGRSTAYLSGRVHAEAIVVAVDRWPYFNPIADRVDAREDLLSAFMSNMRQCKCHNVIPLRAASNIASQILSSGLSAVFIDGDHTYEAVKADVQAWLPKVRPGGIAGGHDYGAEHEGVKRAVDELLPDRFRLIGQSWLIEVTEATKTPI